MGSVKGSPMSTQLETAKRASVSYLSDGYVKLAGLLACFPKNAHRGKLACNTSEHRRDLVIVGVKVTLYHPPMIL